MRNWFLFAATFVLCVIFTAFPAGAEAYWITQSENAKLGSRTVCAGDILTEGQLKQLEGSVTYRIAENGHISAPIQEVFSLGLRKNQPPIAQDSTQETYRDMEITGRLRVQDPENKPMIYTVTRAPRRGVVTLNEDGSFTYTPKKNKVGVDSFAYIAQDEVGNVSREATVTVTIIRPTDDERYIDTMGDDSAFAAEWMRSTGIFVGETLDGKLCFQADKPITQGELLTMVVKVLDLPVEEENIDCAAEYPAWLRPYIAAAMRSGLTGRIPCRIEPDQTATLSQAEALLCFAQEEPTAELLTRGQAAKLMLNVWKCSHGGRMRIL